MLGVAKGSGGYTAPPTPQDVSASISPNPFQGISPNGSYTTPFFNAIASNGVGPFTYSWSIDEGSVLTPSNIKTRVNLSGYNRLVQTVLRLTITDTGDGNKTASATVNVSVSFEDTLR